MYGHFNIFSTKKCLFQQNLSSKSRENAKRNTTVGHLYH